MNWEAANRPKKRRDDSADGDGEGGPPSTKRRSTETVEAALSRLGKAYTTSMECIGALNKANHILLKQPSVTDEQFETLPKVSTAARTTFETSILLDPLITPLAPTLYETMQDFSHRQGADTQKWDIVQETRPVPPVLSSVAHKKTVRDYAYLSLVNYGDLLQSACACDRPSSDNELSPSILDRGIIKPLQLLQNREHCCWEGESLEDTLRLALTAYCDASKLDGSDPTLWLKLACAARGLERLVVQPNDSLVLRSRYRRLQRYALECGSQALSPNLPPNRMVVKALKELNDEPEPTEYPSILLPEAKETELHLELPRYSWSVLGRMLTRACREGSDYVPHDFTQPHHHHRHHHHHHHHHHSRRNMQSSSRSVPLFGSPRIILDLSPMLVMPSRVLGTICLYLEPGSIWRFEATCRALSVSIMAARASMEEDSKRKPLASNQQKGQALNDKEEQSEPQQADNSGGNNDDTNGGEEPPSNVVPAQRRPAREASDGSRNNRASKRLRSQQITTGKREARKSKRASIEYCFLASVLSCTQEEHTQNVKGLLERNPSILRGDNELEKLSPRKRLSILRDPSNNRHRNEARERTGASSLSEFARTWSGRNSGPIDLLGRFLGHVAMNVEDVFASDPAGPTMLSTCLLACFELHLKRSGVTEGYHVQQFQCPLNENDAYHCIQHLAIQVLHAELILRQCDRYTPGCVDFHDDSNLISLMVPRILVHIEKLEKALEAFDIVDSLSRIVLRMKIRINWLTAGFLLWRSRIADDATESLEAEEEALKFIMETAKCFKSPTYSLDSLQTLHLISPGRPESYWKEISPRVLETLRDEIQASSVVSVAQQKFRDLRTAIKERLETSEASTISAEDIEELRSIGALLFQRYSTDDPDAKYSELVENFLSIHGDELQQAYIGDAKSKSRAAKQNLCGSIQTEKLLVSDVVAMSNPSILTILVCSLNMDSNGSLKLSDLLLRAIIATQELEKNLLQRIISGKDERLQSDAAFSDSDDDSSMSSDESSPGSNLSPNISIDEKRIKQCGFLIRFLVERLERLLSSGVPVVEQQDFVTKPKFTELIDSLMKYCSHWFQRTGKHLSTLDDCDTIDHGVFGAVCLLTRSVCSRVKSNQFDMERRVFVGTVKAVIQHKTLFEENVRTQGERSGRAARQRICLKRATFLGALVAELGVTLSTSLSFLESGTLRRSLIIDSSIGSGSEAIDRDTFLSYDEYTIFCDTILWLWKYASQSLHDVVQDENDGLLAAQVCSSFDRPLVKELRSPVAVALIGLCGSSPTTRSSGDATGTGVSIPNATADNSLGLDEFFDSDASANDWSSDAEDDSRAQSSNRKHKELLRVVCHAVYCIDILFKAIDDKGALSILPEKGRGYEFGPILPLVASRVLNHFADILLVEFNDSTEIKHRSKLWADEYPFRTRDLGEVLDSNLHKAYRWLYGFVLVSESEKISGKDLATTVAAPSDLANEDFKLESTRAAAQLYRCILRAYADRRRSPPKAALELVSSALPDMEESARSKILKDFIFSPRDDYISLGHVKTLAANAAGWDDPFTKIRSELTDFTNDKERDGSNLSSTEEEVMIVRRGICSQLAKGPVPTSSSSDAGKSRSDASQDDDRVVSARFEAELSKKFHAIIEDLCLGNAGDAEGWYKAAQCATIKAELIADRLSLTGGYSRSKCFGVPRDQSQSARRPLLPAEELAKEQTREVDVKRSGWVAHLGGDLSLFMKYTWASFSSLRLCSEVLGEAEFSKSKTGEDSSPGLRIWEEIEILFREEKLDDWQQALGGLFVSSLRVVSIRLMSVALFIIRLNGKQSEKGQVMDPELCEALGTVHYGKLMASQEYGYPMHRHAPQTKRELAEVAKICFEKAASQVNESTDDSASASTGQATWDLLLMVGKCEEKIASTYVREAYHPSKSRQYEQHMTLAFESYSSALTQAQTIENDGGVTAGMEGGSSHGVTELLYRLHASRLKCLLNAVSHTNLDVLSNSETEALKLCEKFWFQTPEKSPEDIENESVRDRVWNVLADAVGAFVQCRSDHQFFHRSVYRHAQALMWACVLHDPINGRSKGSLGNLPPARCSLIPGLKNSTTVAESAEAIIGTLFEGRKTQLCAVWLTAAVDTSPYEILNASPRKYDSLRGKYISAYIECLRLNERRPQLESFLKTILSTKRDLALYFQASAKVQGQAPEKPHTQDCLLKRKSSVLSSCFLTTIKRQANSAFARVLYKELTEAKQAPIEPMRGIPTDMYLSKMAYACYLRLNCTVQDLQKLKDWKYGRLTIYEVEALCQADAALGGAAGTSNNNGSPNRNNSNKNLMNWSGATSKVDALKSAIAKCQQVIPNVTANYFTKNTLSKARKAAAEPVEDTTASPSSPSNNTKNKNKKRKSDTISQDSNTNNKTSTADSSATTAAANNNNNNNNNSNKKKTFEVKVPQNLDSGAAFYTTVTVAGVSKKVKLTVPDGKPSSLRFSLPVPPSSTTTAASSKQQTK